MIFHVFMLDLIVYLVYLIFYSLFRLLVIICIFWIYIYNIDKLSYKDRYNYYYRITVYIININIYLNVEN